MEAGIEELIGIEQQKTDGDGREQIQRTALAIEETCDGEECETGGGAHARRAPSGDERVEPHDARGEEERAGLGHEADAAKEEEERGENRDVRA